MSVYAAAGVGRLGNLCVCVCLCERGERMVGRVMGRRGGRGRGRGGEWVRGYSSRVGATLTSKKNMMP